MSKNPQGLYRFDEADAELSLVPMAARRALDVAGQHLSLAEWGLLSHEARLRLIGMGAAPQVDVSAVAQLLQSAGVETRSETPQPDPLVDELPASLVAELGTARPIDLPRWRALGALDRYVLWKHASRGKRDRLAVAYDEILGSAAR